MTRATLTVAAAVLAFALGAVLVPWEPKGES